MPEFEFSEQPRQGDVNGLLHSDVLQSMNEESSLDALNQAFFYNEHSVVV